MEMKAEHKDNQEAFRCLKQKIDEKYAQGRFVAIDQCQVVADAAGFDELRVSAFNTNPSGTFQIIALDNLNVQLNSPIPEPSTVLLLGVGFVGLVAYGKRRRSG